jgi:hypothetical protein
MTALRFYVSGERVGPLFQRSIYREADRVRATARETAREAADLIVQFGREDISRAGNFGSRWTEGLKGMVTEGGGNIRIAISHDVPYWTVFEYGKVILGKPLLWIPLSFATDAKGVWARNFPAPLFRTQRKSDGLLLLGSTVDRQMKYFGKTSVTIPQKFHLRDISRRIAQRIKYLYRSLWDEKA